MHHNQRNQRRQREKKTLAGTSKISCRLQPSVHACLDICHLRHALCNAITAAVLFYLLAVMDSGQSLRQQPAKMLGVMDIELIAFNIEMVRVLQKYENT